MFGPGDAGPTSAGQTVLDFAARRIPGIIPGSFSVVDARDVEWAVAERRRAGGPGRATWRRGGTWNSPSCSRLLERATGVAAPPHSPGFAREWMRAWEEASELAVERVVALFAPDGVYHATRFSEGRGHAGIRTYESMIRTQQNGRGEVEVLGVAGGLGGFRWRISYEVAPRREWPRRVPPELMAAPEWETYRAIPFAEEAPTQVEQAGISTLEFDAEGRVTHYRQAFATRLPE